jgi:hypothetical protein
MKTIRLLPLVGLLFLLLLGQGLAEAQGPFTPTFSVTVDEVAPDNPDILPADDDCPVGAACKLLSWIELPDGQPGWEWGSYAIVPSPTVGFAGDALVPDGAVTGRSLLSVRIGPLGRCPAEGRIISLDLTWLDGTTDASTTTGSPSDLCSFSHWPSQLNGMRDDFLAAHPGAALYARRVGSNPLVCANGLSFTQTDGSVLDFEVWRDRTAAPTNESCGPMLHKEVFLGLSADNPDTPADEGGIPLRTCTAAGTQTVRWLADRRDTPPGDFLALEDTGVCSSNTPVGSNVPVSLNGGTAALAGIDVTFSSVASGGTTSVVTTTAGPPPPTGFKIVGLAQIPLYFDINTGASYSGDLTVCVRYDESQVAGPEANLKLMQRIDSGFVNVTTSVDTANDIICGTTTHLSIFVVVEPLAAPVGGIVEMHVDGSDSPASPADDSAGAGPPYAAIAGGAAAAAFAIAAAGGWYARRRWLR